MHVPVHSTQLYWGPQLDPIPGMWELIQFVYLCSSSRTKSMQEEMPQVVSGKWDRRNNCSSGKDNDISHTQVSICSIAFKWLSSSYVNSYRDWVIKKTKIVISINSIRSYGVMSGHQSCKSYIVAFFLNELYSAT